MRATTIRFTSKLWELLEREARREGVSVAQYVRDAALFRAAYGLGERTSAAAGVGELREELENGGGRIDRRRLHR